MPTVVGDFGMALVVRVDGMDLAITDSQVLTIRKPDGTELTWSPLTIATGAPSYVTYNIVAGDLDQSGVYAGDLMFTWGLLVTTPGQATSSNFSFTVNPGLV